MSVPPEITLKSALREIQLKKLFPRAYRADPAFEASGVLYRNKRFFVIFDNRRAVACIHPKLRKDHPRNEWIEKGQLVGFEGITYDERRRRYHLLVESLPHGKQFNALVETRKKKSWGVDKDGTKILDFSFADPNKGFEGLTWVTVDGKSYLLALCEGNHCKDDAGGGGGRIQVFREFEETRKGDTRHGWQHVKTLALPAGLDFKDYAGLDIRDGRIGVVSQSSSRLWVSKIQLTGEPSKWQITGPGQVYRFPKQRIDGRSKKVYCNLEGIAWMGKRKFAVVSDRPKQDDTDHPCWRKGQAIHIFRLTKPATPAEP